MCVCVCALREIYKAIEFPQAVFLNQEECYDYRLHCSVSAWFMFWEVSKDRKRNRALHLLGVFREKLWHSALVLLVQIHRPVVGCRLLAVLSQAAQLTWVWSQVYYTQYKGGSLLGRRSLEVLCVGFLLWFPFTCIQHLRSAFLDFVTAVLLLGWV